MKRYTASEKILIIDKVVKEGATAYSVCRTYGISKPTFYSWLKRYRRGRKNRALALESKVRSSVDHPKSIDYKGRLRVLSLVHKHPEYSCHKIAQVLAIGNHGVQGVLEREGLGRFEARLVFSKKPFWKREPAERRLGMLELYEQGWKVTEICKLYGISKQTFGKWRGRYEQGEALDDRFVRGDGHHKFLGHDREGQILDFVSKNPQMSVHKIAGQFAGVVGHHGVQNVLARHNLGTYEQRLAFSRLTEEAWKPSIKVADVFYMPLKLWRLLFAPFATIPKAGWLITRGRLLLPLIFLLGFYFYKLGAAIVTSPTGNPVGTFFAAVSLTFGLFFLFYSLKYYVSALLVLKLAQSGSLDPSIAKTERLEDRRSGLGRLFATMLNVGGFARAHELRTNHLSVNLDKVDLKGKAPFVSVHIACYNEKRVIARLLAACTAQDWATLIEPIDSALQSSSRNAGLRAYKTDLTDSAKSVSNQYKSANYEVVIADDSKDETTEIAKQTLISADFKLIDSALRSSVCDADLRAYGADSVKGTGTDSKDEEIFVFTKPGAPTVKIIHRFSRDGFKGGALARALANTDKRAQYVAIFDADFVPYPDTIEQFVKTFQVLNANDMRMENARMDANISKNSHNSNSPTNSPVIAAVQGYQWHVLNKSENWVTRGVRTEYAGSYVVERCGEEIYGGLKQIAGSVYMIRADVLREFGWGRSITEDFELTLKLYEAGYKVAFTPYIQAPAEAVSTLKRLIRQRMRWAEGASFNIKIMLPRILRSQRMTGAEKFEFAYLAPYYLQAAFFIVGTLSWFLAEVVLGSRLPFWTAALGWSLVFTNLLALPLMNIIGLFLEESQERDYVGILSFLALSYIVVPFQAYAAIKGFVEKEEGPWFRTPKTGLITDTFGRAGFRKFFGDLFGGHPAAGVNANADANLSMQMDANMSAKAFGGRLMPSFAIGNPIRPRYMRRVGNLALGFVVAITILMGVFAPIVPVLPEAHAKKPRLATLNSQPEESGREKLEITNPVALKFGQTQGGLEYIFHPEPRVRTKLKGYEVEMELAGASGLGKISSNKTYNDGGNYIYEEVFEGVDLVYIPAKDKLTEEIVMNSYKDLREVNYEIKTVGLSLAQVGGEIHFAPSSGGDSLIHFTKPYLYEKQNSQNKSFGIEYVLTKNTFGWELKKRLTPEGQRWLADANRAFPVVIDPTQVISVIEGSKSGAEIDWRNQRKIAYSTRGGSTDGWYAVYAEGTDVFVERCLVDTSCDANGDWTNLAGSAGSGTDLDSGDADNTTPTVWLEGTVLWIAWFDDSADSVQFKDLATTTDSLGSGCTMTDMGTGNIGAAVVTIAVADDGDIFTAISEDSLERFGVFKSTSACLITDITSGSGISGADFLDSVTIGNDYYLFMQQGSGLVVSVWDDVTPNWDTLQQSINSATDTDFSVATDGADIWAAQVGSGNSQVDFFYCSVCDTTPIWSTQTDPFSGLAELDFVSVGYITSGTTVVVSTVDQDSANRANDLVKFCTSTDNGSNWTCGTNYSFVADTSGLERISSTMLVTNDTEFAATVREATNSEFEFSTLPENLWILAVFAPLLPKVLKKMRRKGLDFF